MLPVGLWLIDSYEQTGAEVGPLLPLLVVAAVALVVPLWVPWLYRRAKRPVEALQREVAVTLAREASRKRLLRGW